MPFIKILVISPGLLYHLIRHGTRGLANEAFTSNPIVCRGLKITKWLGYTEWNISAVSPGDTQ